MGELEAQKKVLIALQAGEPSEELKSEFRKLKNTLTSSNTALNNLATNTENYRQRCLISRIKAKANESFDGTECDRYASSSSSAYESVESSTELFACVRDLDFQVNAFEQSREALNQTAQEIERQIEALQQRLSTTDVKFSHLAREAQHAADSQDILDSQWLSFQFDSKRYKSSSSTLSSRTTSNFAASASGGFGFFSFSASYSSSRSRSDYSFQAAMNSAETVVGGELLRVTVQRPWFRPSLFKSKDQFQIRGLTHKISPGYIEGEKQYVHEITRRDSNYLLPEYVTGLLLSRNINVEFRGISASRSARAVRTASSSRFSARVGFGPWGGSVSGGKSQSSYHRTYSMESTSDGLRVSIPGAQIIGYYIQVMPEFPAIKKDSVA
ncbi:hypothetical protein GBAR_LOCUS19863 [Geodia barretti]|nr:hypothetical protein GBAR_LOCUS19863 [Geodia barretti]